MNFFFERASQISFPSVVTHLTSDLYKTVFVTRGKLLKAESVL